MRRTLLIATLLAAAAAARGDALRLIAPADGAILRGGHFTRLSWTPERLGSNAEEWEAFLSVDGGRYYAVRLTPHLDIHTRSFDVLIPNVDADDVRLLFRTGDERHESILEMPQRLRIRAEATAQARVETEGVAPEAARPSDPPVVMWNTGDAVQTTATPPNLAPSASAPNDSDVSSEAPRAAGVLCGGQAPSPVRTAGGGCHPPRSAPRRDVLLQTSRLNV